MLAEDAYCVDVLTQLGSIASATERSALIVLKDHTQHCVRHSIKHGEEAGERIEELMSAVERFLKVQRRRP